MGQQIVYCGKCGNSLRHDDFEKGKAVVVDAISYCAACLPAPASSKLAPPEPARSSVSTTRIRTVPPPAPSTRRRVAETDRTSSLPIVLGGVGAFVAVVVLVVFLSGGSSDPPPAPPPPPPAPPPSSSAAAETWARLEGHAAAGDPDEVLLRCEEASKVLRGTPHEPQLRALEARMREKKKARDAERQLAQSIEEARKFMGSEARFTQQEEFRRLLDRLLATPGAHQPEVRQISETWEKQLKERAAAPPPPPPPQVVEGAHALGSQGEICHWLVLGTFANTPDQEAMYLDHLRSDGNHPPAAGTEVARREGGRVAWTTHAAPDGSVLFRKIPALGAANSTNPALAFAACWLVVENDLPVKFRINADTGYRLRLNGEQVGNQPRGHEFGKEPETYGRTLLRGANLLQVKVGTVGAAFGLKLRVTTTGSMTERAPGVTVALAAPPSGRVLVKEAFETGPGRFTGGEVRQDGGQKVLAVSQKGAQIEKFTTARVGPGSTLRFRYKAPAGLPNFYVLAWSQERKANHWYHIKGVRTGEWAEATVPLKDLKGGFRMDGPSMDGQVPTNLIFRFEPPKNPDLVLLIDDVEITE